jgi:hypothetical protein
VRRLAAHWRSFQSTSACALGLVSGTERFGTSGRIFSRRAVTWSRIASQALRTSGAGFPRSGSGKARHIDWTFRIGPTSSFASNAAQIIER